MKYIVNYVLPIMHSKLVLLTETMEHHIILILLCAIKQIAGLQVTQVDQSVVRLDNETFTISVTLHYTASQNDPTVIEIDKFGASYYKYNDNEIDPLGWSVDEEPGRFTLHHKLIVRLFPKDYSTHGLEDYVLYHNENVRPFKILVFSFNLRRSHAENSPVIGTIRESVDFEGEEFTKTRVVQSPVWIQSPSLITNCHWLQFKTIKWRFSVRSIDPPFFRVYHYHLEKLNNIVDTVGGQSVLIDTELGRSGSKDLEENAKIHYSSQKTNDRWDMVVEVKIKWFSDTHHPGLYGIYFYGNKYDHTLDFTYNNKVVIRYGEDSFFEPGHLDMTIRYDLVSEWMLDELNQIPTNNVIPQALGSPLTLTCHVLGHKVSKVTWVKDDEILSEQKIAKLGGTTNIEFVKGVDYVRNDLRFSDFKNSLSGSYTCRAEAAHNLVRDMTYEVQGYSRVDVDISVTTWTESEAHIHCSANSHDKIVSNMQFLVKDDPQTTDWSLVDLDSGDFSQTITNIQEMANFKFGLLIVKKTYNDLKDDSFRCQILGEIDGAVQKGQDDLKMKDIEDFDI